MRTTYVRTLRALTTLAFVLAAGGTIGYSEGATNTKTEYKTLPGHSAPAFGNTITDLTP